MSDNRYDSWRQRVPVEVVVGECEQCGAEIYMENEHYRTDEGRFCDKNCLDEFVENVFNVQVVSGIEGVLDY